QTAQQALPLRRGCLHKRRVGGLLAIVSVSNSRSFGCVDAKRRWGERPLSPARFCAALSSRTNFVPAIVDGVFEALPGAGVARFPVAAGVGFQCSPVAPPVALVRA